MKQTLTKTKYLFRRELWEHRSGVIWTPMVIAVGAIALIILSITFGLDGDFNRHLNQVVEWTGGQRLGSGDEPTQRIDFARGEIVAAKGEDLDWVLWGSHLMGLLTPTLHSIAVGFEFIALMVAFFYLLGGLFNDRKDRTILFWKSLPFSESHSIAVKLLFASLVIPLFALAVSLFVQLFFAATTVVLITSNTDFTLAQVLGDVSVIPVFLAHLLLVLVFAIKNLPLFAWLLFCSAVSKRSPFLTAILPPIVIAALERLVFGSSYFTDFLASLLSGVQYNFGEEYTGSLLRSLITITPIQLLKIVAVSLPLLAGTVWLRNHRYEL